MTYSYGGWTLFARDVQPRRGPKVTIYFFSKKRPKAAKETDLRPGYKVAVNKRTGLPFLVSEKSELSEETRKKLNGIEKEVASFLEE